jgi:hypothetical protein
MAVRMDIIDALLVLTRHGYLVTCEPVQGKRYHRVFKQPPGNVPGRCVGHITDKQFEQLARRGVLYQINQRASRDGIYTYFELDAARAEVEYGG